MMTGIELGMGLGGSLWMVLGIILIVLLAWVLVSAIAGRERASTDETGQILKARFARGEITQAEYEQARRLLGI